MVVVIVIMMVLRMIIISTIILIICCCAVPVDQDVSVQHQLNHNTQLKPRMSSPRAPDHWPQPAKPACNMTCGEKSLDALARRVLSVQLFQGIWGRINLTWSPLVSCVSIPAGMRQECWQWIGRESGWRQATEWQKAIRASSPSTLEVHPITRTLWHHRFSRHHKGNLIFFSAQAVSFEVNKKRPSSEGRVGNWNLTHQELTKRSSWDDLSD